MRRPRRKCTSLLPRIGTPVHVFGEVVKVEENSSEGEIGTYRRLKVDQISGKPSAEEKKRRLENNKERVSVHVGTYAFRVRAPASPEKSSKA
jgi:hypothetical protein